MRNLHDFGEDSKITDIIDLNDQVVKLMALLAHTNRTVLGFSGEGLKNNKRFWVTDFAK